MKNSKEKKLTKKEFILVIFVILILSGATYWHFKSWRESLGKIKNPKPEIPKPKLPEFKMPELSYPLGPKKEGYKEWVSPDKKLKMKYPADWIEMERKIFENIPQEEAIKGETLFFAQKLDFEEKIQGFLSVQKLFLEEGKSLKEILDEMEKEVIRKNGEMKILKLETIEKAATFEAIYRGETSLPLHSKEKIVLAQGETLLVSFFTFEKDWTKFKEEAEGIINSVQLLE